jgi:lipoprotein-releasing system ATP-binding protein
MGAAMTLLSVDNVTRQFPATGEGDATAGAAPLQVLRGINLSIDAGATAAIIGPSGSGKSTLLHLLGALDRPTAGRITLDGQSLGELDDRHLAALRSRRIGFVFQFHHLLPQCTVLENVLVPTLPLGADAARQARPRAQLLLDKVGLANRMAHRPGQLSGGERQRVAVVRALINQPALVLADEPTGSLDRASAERLVALLVELNESQNAALVMVTHAVELCDRLQKVYELRDGVLHDHAGTGAGAGRGVAT